MVERTINVRGVELTKGDLEGALKTLEATTFEPGDIVQWKDEDNTGQKFVVVAPGVAAALRRHYSVISQGGPNIVQMIGLRTGESYSPPASMLRKVQRVDL